MDRRWRRTCRGTWQQQLPCPLDRHPRHSDGKSETSHRSHRPRTQCLSSALCKALQATANRHSATSEDHLGAVLYLAAISGGTLLQSSRYGPSVIVTTPAILAGSFVPTQPQGNTQ